MDVISRRQAIEREITYSQLRHNVRTGQWQRVFAGVFVMHNGVVSWRERVAAAVLARGPGTLTSLRCALRLWNLTDREPQIITLIEPRQTHRTRELRGVQVRRRTRSVPARRYGIPVTALPQTIMDVLALPDQTLDDVMALVTRAVSRKKVTVAELSVELAQHPRHPRRRLLAEALAAAEEGLESTAEVRYARDVEGAHGLPRMERQAWLDGMTAQADGRARRLDFRDPVRGLRVEIDGALFHGERQLADRWRDRQAVGAGEATLRAGWIEVVERPCALAADVAVAQIARGW
ncbi:MAG: hypothetical protein Q4P07_12980, partial [Ornithinimicrobium sp.]|uniref:hypothetical protein n=1 Tax=Ornithinimicrobium sp. TaxID=1977084 RepID=UPI0026DF7359